MIHLTNAWMSKVARAQTSPLSKRRRYFRLRKGQVLLCLVNCPFSLKFYFSLNQLFGRPSGCKGSNNLTY